MKMPRIAIVVLALFAGITAGWWLRGNPARDFREDPEPTVADRRLPVPHESPSQVVFDEGANFSDMVVQLQASGFDQAFAKWAALVEIGQRNFREAFDVAKAEDLVIVWATGAATQDPKAAVELIAALSRDQRRTAFAALLEQLGRIDPDMGLALLLRNPEELTGADAFRFFEAMAESSPKAAAEAASGLVSPVMRNRALSGAFHAWSVVDPNGMMAWATKQGRREGQMALRSFYEGNGMRDPERVLALMERHPEISDWVTLVELSSSLAAKGEAGLERVLAVSDRPRRREMLTRFGADLSRTDPEALWRLVESVESDDRRYLVRLATQGLNKARPAEMAELAVQGGLGGTHYLRSAVETWAAEEPAAALRWASANLSGRQRSEAISEAMKGWMKGDPERSVGALEGLPPAIRSNVLPQVSQVWGKSDPAKALSWAESLRPIDRAPAVSGVIEGWAEADPKAAAERLWTIPASGMEQTFERVARRVAETDPKFGVEWVARLSDEAASGIAARNVARVWGERDAEAASVYVKGLAPGVVRDRAAQGLVEAIERLDPETAAGWALAIGDSERRSSLVRRVVMTWQKRDAAAARRYVEAMPESEMRQDLLNRLAK